MFNLPKTLKFFAATIIISFMMSGCATLFKGSNENVDFNSDPAGAKVYVNGQLMGSTPLQLKLESDKSYTIEFRQDGFETRTYQKNHSIAAGYIILDILGGFVPVIIDAATGAWYTLDKDNLNAVMEKKN